MQWETVIGLEIHTQLATKSKIFSGSSTAFGNEPNTQASLIDLGMPGVLPVLNREAVRMAVRFGKAIGAHVAERSAFARKNYFYPDLPKGYQISQFEEPLARNGRLKIKTSQGEKTIRILRAHLEEDAGKLTHAYYILIVLLVLSFITLLTMLKIPDANAADRDYKVKEATA